MTNETSVGGIGERLAAALDLVVETGSYLTLWQTEGESEIVDALATWAAARGYRLDENTCHSPRGEVKPVLYVKLPNATRAVISLHWCTS